MLNAVAHFCFWHFEHTGPHCRMGLQSGVVWRVGRVWVWRVWVLRVCFGVVDSLGHVEHQSTAHLWIERFCNIEDIEDMNFRQRGSCIKLSHLRCVKKSGSEVWALWVSGRGSVSGWVFVFGFLGLEGWSLLSVGWSVGVALCV